MYCLLCDRERPRRLLVRVARCEHLWRILEIRKEHGYVKPAIHPVGRIRANEVLDYWDVCGHTDCILYIKILRQEFSSGDRSLEFIVRCVHLRGQSKDSVRLNHRRRQQR